MCVCVVESTSSPTTFTTESPTTATTPTESTVSTVTTVPTTATTGIIIFFLAHWLYFSAQAAIGIRFLITISIRFFLIYLCRKVTKYY